LYSPVTKQLYPVNDRQTPVGPSTYERPWSIQPGYGFETPVYPLSPIDYCTPDTADAVLTWAKSMWPTLLFDIYAPTPTGGFVTAPQYWLLVTNGTDLYEVYGAGHWSFDLDKDGEQAAYQQRTAELRQAGFSV
jgi:hypothetical protein